MCHRARSRTHTHPSFRPPDPTRPYSVGACLPNLRTLKLNENPTLGSRGVGELIDFIEESTSLSKLELRLCDIGNEGMRKLAKMKTPKQLRTVDISYNRIGAKYVLRFIENKSNRTCNLLYEENNMTANEYGQLRVAESVL